jgi:hypothetical protein
MPATSAGMTKISALRPQLLDQRGQFPALVRFTP